MSRIIAETTFPTGHVKIVKNPQCQKKLCNIL